MNYCEGTPNFYLFFSRGITFIYCYHYKYYLFFLFVYYGDWIVMHEFTEYKSAHSIPIRMVNYKQMVCFSLAFQFIQFHRSNLHEYICQFAKNKIQYVTVQNCGSINSRDNSQNGKNKTETYKQPMETQTKKLMIFIKPLKLLPTKKLQVFAFLHNRELDGTQSIFCTETNFKPKFHNFSPMHFAFE